MGFLHYFGICEAVGVFHILYLIISIGTKTYSGKLTFSRMQHRLDNRVFFSTSIVTMEKRFKGRSYIKQNVSKFKRH